MRDDLNSYNPWVFIESSKCDLICVQCPSRRFITEENKRIPQNSGKTAKKGKENWEDAHTCYDP